MKAYGEIRDFKTDLFCKVMKYRLKLKYQIGFSPGIIGADGNNKYKGFDHLYFAQKTGKLGDWLSSTKISSGKILQVQKLIWATDKDMSHPQ